MTECLVYISDRFGCLTYISSLNTLSNLWGKNWYYYPHFTKKEIKYGELNNLPNVVLYVAAFIAF